MSLKYLSILFGVLTIGFFVKYIELNLKIKKVERKFQYEHQDQIDAYFENRKKIFNEWNSIKDSLINKWISDLDSLSNVRNSNTQIANKKMRDELNSLIEPVAPGIVEINKNAKNQLTIAIGLFFIAIILAVWYKIIKNNSPNPVVKIRETSNTNLTPLERFITRESRRFENFQHESGNLVMVNTTQGPFPVAVGAMENGLFLEPEGTIFLHGPDDNSIPIQVDEIIGVPVIKTKQEYLDDMLAKFYTNQQTGDLVNNPEYDFDDKSFDDIGHAPTKHYSTPRERFTADKQQQFETIRHESGNLVTVNTAKYGPVTVYSGKIENGKFVEPTGEIFVYHPETGEPVVVKLSEVIGEPTIKSKEDWMNKMLCAFDKYEQEKLALDEIAFEYEGKQWVESGLKDEKGNVFVELYENGELTGQNIILTPEEFEQAQKDQQTKK